MKYLPFILILLFACEKERISVNQFIDERDGQVYSYAEFGNQIWMTENLRYLPSDGSAYFFTDYGVMYTFIAAINSCPQGWHLPTEDEWLELIAYLGEDPGQTLKEGEFNALLGGWYQNEYNSESRIGAWWSATEAYNSYAWVYYVNGWENVLTTNLHKSCKLTIRCIKD